MSAPALPVEAGMKLTFIVNVPSFFLSHRLPIAMAAKQGGWHVDVVAGHENSIVWQAKSAHTLAQAAIPYHLAAFTAAGVNPFSELRGLLSVIRNVRAIQPDIVHTASPKANLYGGIAARLCRVPKLVVAVSGQGFLFTGKRSGVKASIATLYLALIRWVFAHPNCTVIVQNQDDWNSLLANKLVRVNQLVLIPGSGVDLSLFADQDLQQAQNIVLLPARMLTDKGIAEFVAAAEILKQRGIDWRFVLVGEADGPNPAAIRSEQINAWVEQGHVEWWGYQADMPAVFKQAAIVCLPSYREGMPKALLEAAAAGKPVVTTDVIGCREAIVPGGTGLLVPAANAEALADALDYLIKTPDLREHFSVERVVSRVLDIYHSS
jgi:glycosyltransferase involved in cell wall biosynthesis